MIFHNSMVPCRWRGMVVMEGDDVLLGKQQFWFLNRNTYMSSCGQYEAGLPIYTIVKNQPEGPSVLQLMKWWMTRAYVLEADHVTAWGTLERESPVLVGPPILGGRTCWLYLSRASALLAHKGMITWSKGHVKSIGWQKLAPKFGTQFDLY